jgi:hypothetical protein
MRLIYRGQVYEYTPVTSITYQRPPAMNWRFQVTEGAIDPTPRPAPSYRPPRAINWRFQVAMTGE